MVANVQTTPHAPRSSQTNFNISRVDTTPIPPPVDGILRDQPLMMQEDARVVHDGKLPPILAPGQEVVPPPRAKIREPELPHYPRPYDPYVAYDKGKLDLCEHRRHTDHEEELYLPWGGYEYDHRPDRRDQERARWSFDQGRQIANYMTP